MNPWIMALVVLLAGPALYLILKDKAGKVDRAKTASRLPKGPPALEAVELIGLTGTVISDRLDATSGAVRVVDSQGRARDMQARLDDSPRPLARGHEVLVIENPREGLPAIVVPADLPGLDA